LGGIAHGAATRTRIVAHPLPGAKSPQRFAATDRRGKRRQRRSTVAPARMRGLRLQGIFCWSIS
jgi:hypothetical protein